MSRVTFLMATPSVFVLFWVVLPCFLGFLGRWVVHASLSLPNNPRPRCMIDGKAIVLMTIAVGVAGLAYSGFNTNIIDVAPHNAGLLMSVSNTLATVPGTLATCLFLLPSSFFLLHSSFCLMSVSNTLATVPYNSINFDLIHNATS